MGTTGADVAIEAKPRYRWVILLLSWLLYFSFGLLFTAISVLVTPVMDSLHLTYSQMGIVLGSWPLVYIFFAQLAGVITDRIGPYRSLFIGAMIIATSSALRGFAHSFETLLLFVALFGIGGPLISIGLPKLASLWFIGRERGTASGVYATGPSAGGMVALSITNSIVMPAVGGWRNVFLVYSVVGFLIALLWLVMGRRMTPTPSTTTGAEEIRLNTRSVIGNVLRNRNIWLIVLIGVTFFLASHGISSWLPKILELRGMSPQEAGFVVSSRSLFGIMGSFLLPRLPYIVKSRKLAIALTLFVLGVAILALGFVSGIFIWFALLAVGITNQGLLPLLTVTLMDMPEVGARRMGIVGGLFFAIGEIGGFAGPLVMGLLKDITGTFLTGILFIVAITEASILLAAFLEVDSPARNPD
jgi:cyanate permease